MYRDVPLEIMRSTKLHPLQKAFLLWCWAVRETDRTCALISCRQDCAVRDRSIKWYADFFNLDRHNFSNRIFSPLVEAGIIVTEHVGSRNEITYVDFTKIE